MITADKKLTVANVKELFEPKNVLIVYASAPVENKVYLSNNQNDDPLGVFDRLFEYLEGRVLLINVRYLKQEDIDDALITDEMIERAGITGSFLRKVKPQITAYNKNIDSFSKFVEQESYLELCFASEGIVYSLVSLTTIELEDPEEFLESLTEQYSEEHQEARYQERQKLRRETEEYKETLVEQLYSELIKDSNFLLCTNTNLRERYARKYYDAHPQYSEKGLNTYDIYNVIDLVWRKYKQNK